MDDEEGKEIAELARELENLIEHPLSRHFTEDERTILMRIFINMTIRVERAYFGQEGGTKH